MMGISDSPNHSGPPPKLIPLSTLSHTPIFVAPQVGTEHHHKYSKELAVALIFEARPYPWMPDRGTSSRSQIRREALQCAPRRDHMWYLLAHAVAPSPLLRSSPRLKAHELPHPPI